MQSSALLAPRVDHRKGKGRFWRGFHANVYLVEDVQSDERPLKIEITTNSVCVSS